MPRPTKIRRKDSVSVRDFFDFHGERLEMTLTCGSEEGFRRGIFEPTINRPGLALAGFFTYFAFKRVQVIGNGERSYLNNLKAEDARQRFRELCTKDIPCIVTARGRELTDDLNAIAQEAGICVFQTSMVTMNFINAATIRLEREFAPSCSIHGCMVDVRGIGVLIRGGSGVGKSECALGLIERGASLVADDIVIFSQVEGEELIGTAPEMGRSHMEVRGIGIVNVAAMYGVASIRLHKRLDLVVTLTPIHDINEIERHGIRRQTFEILSKDVPHIELPVAPGRDMSHLVELAALDQKLRSMGHDAALEFDEKLLKTLESKRIN